MLIALVYFTVTIVVYWFAIKWILRRRARENTIGIFHLNCSAGGGGERVLWHMVRILLNEYPKHTIFIYTNRNNQCDPLQILFKVRNLFQIDLISDERALERLEFIPLSLAPLVETKNYPFLTLCLQNLMSMLVAIQAAYYLVPQIYIETIGFSFTIPVFKMASCTVITYVHYPIISYDMIDNVRLSSHASFNNREIFIRSPTLRAVKLLYYRLLAYLYGLVGRQSDLVLVNSSWTQAHIKSLWNCDARIVHPPCDVASFKSLSLERFSTRASNKSLRIVSIAQFRPEKNHQMQIEALDLLINRAPGAQDSKLSMFGGCRNTDDQRRVDYLNDLTCRLDMSSNVEIIANASFEQLLDGLREADVAIHTMANEHFGIVLLEFMAAGLITVAHNSGGPKEDIIDDKHSGFLCNDVEDFANVLCSISKMTEKERGQIRANAVKKAEQFSDQVFESSLLRELRTLEPAER